MKLIKENRRLTFMSLFLASALIAGIHSASVKAQDDMLDEANDSLSGDDSLQMEDINLEGKLSPSERLRQRREKLEERNKIMVEKKIEDIRVKQEIALTNKLQDAFGKSLNNLNEDKVQVVQAAPVAPQPVVVAAPAPIIERIIEVKEEKIPEIKKSKVIPYLGAQSIKGDKIDFESKLNIGANLETMISNQFSVGLGVGYTSLDITDVANDFVNSGSVYNPTYYNSFGTGRKMSSTKITIEANSKYFLTVESRIKPFVGAGVSYNRSNLKYDDNGNGVSQNGVNFGNEGYSSTAMGATAKLGAEVDFNETVGLNIDLSFTKTLSSGISSTANTSNNNPDQGRLQNVTKSMEDSDITSIQAGLVVRF
jgi:opacity protein-like surface antigen